MVFTNTNPLVCFNRWFKGQGQAQDDQGSFPAVHNETTLMDLPIEVRVLIWEYLPIQDHRAIRQICKQFQWEINHVVGVHAILLGPKPLRPKNFVESYLFSLIKLNPEAIRVEENIDWIRNSTIRGLKLSRFNGMSFDSNTLITNTHVLRRLVVELGKDLTPKPKVMEILNKCLNLDTIDISSHYPRDKDVVSVESVEALEPFRKDAVSFTKDLLQSLVTKPGLKKLNIKFRIVVIESFTFARRTFMGIPEAAAEPLTKYPSTIQKLAIKFPIFNNSVPTDRSELTSWKVLLDQQTELRELNVNLGLVHWTYFTTVVRNSVNTLQKLSLRLSNWNVPRTDVNWNDVPLEVSELDWTALLPNTLNLTSLKVAMSTWHFIGFDRLPQPTKNLRNMVWTALSTLQLVFVALSPEDFIWIFSKLPSLSDIQLGHWSQLDLPETELVETARTTFLPLFHALLRSNQLDKIIMADLCILRCPKYLRGLIDALPNYKTDWPEFGTYEVVEVGNALNIRVKIFPITITRKPETEIIQANMFNLN